MVNQSFDEIKQSLSNYINANKDKLKKVPGWLPNSSRATWYRIQDKNLSQQSDTFIDLIEDLEDLHKDPKKKNDMDNKFPLNELYKFKYEQIESAKDTIETVQYKSAEDFIRLCDEDWEIKQEGRCIKYREKFKQKLDELIKNETELKGTKYYLNFNFRANINPRISKKITDEKLLNDIGSFLENLQRSFKVQQNSQLTVFPSLIDRAFVNLKYETMIKNFLKSHKIYAGFKFLPQEIIVDLNPNTNFLIINMPTVFFWSIKFGEFIDLSFNRGNFHSESLLFDNAIEKVKSLIKYRKQLIEYKK